MIMSRMLRTKIPTLKQNLKPKISQYVVKRIEDSRKKSSYYYSKGSYNRVPLGKGDNIVYINKGKWLPGLVVDKHTSPRSYIIRNEQGR